VLAAGHVPAHAATVDGPHHRDRLHCDRIVTNAENTRGAARLRELFGHPKLVWLVLLVAIVVALPTLDVGLIGDDLPQAQFLTAQREGTSTAPWWDMFVLVGGPRAHNEELRAIGRLPWWVDLDLRVAFFRPLSVATHQLDHRLWPDRAWAMHLHSVLWYAAACVLVWVVARRLSSSRSAAGVASLVYAGSFAHLVPVGWLAHRNGVISTVFCLLTILAHDRWRRERDRLAGLLAPIALSAALLAGEAGVVTLAFVLAHALILDAGTRRARAMSLLPSLVVIVLWRLLYDALGYGATGSGAYLDPITDPSGFVGAFPQRYVTLLAFCVSPPVVPELAISWWILTLALVGIAGVFVVRVDRPAARFGVLAAVLGCIPLTASVPFERLLMSTSVGMALVWGELVDAWLWSKSATRWARAAGVLVVVVHLVLSPVAFVVRGRELDAQLRLREKSFTEPAWPLSPAMVGKTMVVVHTPNYLAFEYLPQLLAAEGLAGPERVWVLHAGAESPQIERLDDHTLELRVLLGWPADTVTNFWRDAARAPFVVGDRIQTRDFTATIEAVEGGKATRVRFRFATPLDDPTQVWVQLHDGQHRKINPAIW
jgi:hypothetical protein